MVSRKARRGAKDAKKISWRSLHHCYRCGPLYFTQNSQSRNGRKGIIVAISASLLSLRAILFLRNKFIFINNPYCKVQ